MPAFARRLSVVSVMLGTTRTVTGGGLEPRRARRRRANTARTWPLAGSTTLAAQVPSGPAAVVVTGVQAAPARRVLDRERRAGRRGAVGEAQQAGDGDRA